MIRFTVFFMGLSLIVGGFMLLLALPDYVSDILRLLVLMVMVVTGLGLVVKS